MLGACVQQHGARVYLVNTGWTGGPYGEGERMKIDYLIAIGGDGTLRAVGECRLVGDDWPREAELAFSVEGRFQGQGIGTELFRRLVMFARNRSVKKAYLITEPSNERAPAPYSSRLLPNEPPGRGQLVPDPQDLTTVCTFAQIDATAPVT
jgi:GNAT superfamily N-acetyltransferase